jgi:hypothetical protein
MDDRRHRCRGVLSLLGHSDEQMVGVGAVRSVLTASWTASSSQRLVETWVVGGAAELPTGLRLTGRSGGVVEMADAEVEEGVAAARSFDPADGKVTD